MQFKGELLCGEKKCEKHPKNKKKFFGREILKLRGDISPLKALERSLLKFYLLKIAGFVA